MQRSCWRCSSAFHCQINYIQIKADDLREKLCKSLQIEKTRTTPYQPQGDGLRERTNRTILDMLVTVIRDHKDWESHLRATCMAYNTSAQSTTGQSPFFLMFERREGKDTI